MAGYQVETYRTTDLHWASYLVSKGVHMLEVVPKEENPNQFYFVFDKFFISDKERLQYHEEWISDMKSRKLLTSNSEVRRELSKAKAKQNNRQ